MRAPEGSLEFVVTLEIEARWERRVIEVLQASMVVMAWMENLDK